jgi:hypothetical protein
MKALLLEVCNANGSESWVGTRDRKAEMALANYRSLAWARPQVFLSIIVVGCRSSRSPIQTSLVKA